MAGSSAGGGGLYVKESATEAMPPCIALFASSLFSAAAAGANVSQANKGFVKRRTPSGSGGGAPTRRRRKARSKRVRSSRARGAARGVAVEVNTHHWQVLAIRATLPLKAARTLRGGGARRGRSRRRGGQQHGQLSHVLLLCCIDGGQLVLLQCKLLAGRRHLLLRLRQLQRRLLLRLLRRGSLLLQVGKILRLRRRKLAQAARGGACRGCQRQQEE